MAKASDRQKRSYDHRINYTQYQKGCAVWLRVHTKKKGLSPKLMNYWDGPYLVMDVISDLTYKI